MLLHSIESSHPASAPTFKDRTAGRKTIDHACRKTCLMSKQHSEFLLQDYIEARADARAQDAATVTLLALAVPLLTALVAFAQAVLNDDRQFPELVIAVAPIFPFAVLTHSLWIGSKSTVTSFYLRALEREIREQLRPDDLRHYPGLKMMSLSEISAENSSPHGAKLRPGKIAMLMTTVASFTILSFVIITLLLRVGWSMRWVMLVCYLPLALLCLYASLQTSFLGREHVRSLIEDCGHRLNQPLHKHSSPRSHSAEPVIKILLPRPDDLIKMLYTAGGLLLGIYTFSSPGQPPNASWLVAVCGLLVFELLAYQARYHINDILGVIEDTRDPMSVERNRLTQDQRASHAVAAALKIVYTVGAVLTIYSHSSYSLFATRLALAVGGIFALMVPYELLRNHVRYRNGGTLTHFILLFLVTQGYPLRLLGMLWCVAGQNVSFPMWVTLWVLTTSLGFVSMTFMWSLECFKYVHAKYRDPEKSSLTTYFTSFEIARKSHLLCVARCNQWNIVPSDEHGSQLPKETQPFDGKNARIFLERTYRPGIKLWSWGLTSLILSNYAFALELVNSVVSLRRLPPSGAVGLCVCIVLLLGLAAVPLVLNDFKPHATLAFSMLSGLAIITAWSWAAFSYNWVAALPPAVIALYAIATVRGFYYQSYASTRGATQSILKKIKAIAEPAWRYVIYGAPTSGH